MSAAALMKRIDSMKRTDRMKWTDSTEQTDSMKRTDSTKRTDIMERGASAFVLAATVALLLVTIAPGSAAAQSRAYAVALTGGSGLSFGTGAQSTVIARTPVFVDVAFRTTRSDQPTLAYGGSLRVEIDGRVGIGGVVRAELVVPLGPLALRAGAGVPFFFAPYVLFGVEGSLTVRWPASAPFAVTASILLDAYFAGSDLPRDSALFMTNGALGVDLLF